MIEGGHCEVCAREEAFDVVTRDAQRDPTQPFQESKVGVVVAEQTVDGSQDSARHLDNARVTVNPLIERVGWHDIPSNEGVSINDRLLDITTMQSARMQFAGELEVLASDHASRVNAVE